LPRISSWGNISIFTSNDNEVKIDVIYLGVKY
jgi:hypothetical protein